MLHATERVNGAVLWANLHLLFWLSLVPFATRWMGETISPRCRRRSTACVLLLAAIAYTILPNDDHRAPGPDSVLRSAIGGDRKGKISLVLYAVAIPLAW